MLQSPYYPAVLHNQPIKVSCAVFFQALGTEIWCYAMYAVKKEETDTEKRE
jgi:hypothetical protein